MIDPAQLSLALANRWDAIASQLGTERPRLEHELIGLLRELALADAARKPDVAAQILALFGPHPQALAALKQALRDASPGSTKGGGGPAGFVNAGSRIRYPVFFGTDRAAAAGTTTTMADFSGERGSLTWGIADVSLPDDARLGRTPRPLWWKLVFRSDPDPKLELHSVQTLSRDDFIARARGTLQGAAGKQVLVFIHGYNVAFRAALERAAQLAFDLQFEGLAALYSWPSEASAPKYTVDEGNIEWSRPRFAEFLTVLREQLGVQAVHVIAHSMGNRLLVETLTALAAAPAAGLADLQQVVFAAPDVDAGVFKDRAAAFQRVASRCTLYASSHDLALAASKKVHKYRRAGDSGLDLVIAPAVDTIDVSAVDTSLLGHSYYGDNRSVLSDLFYLLREGLPPQRRHGLVEKSLYGGRYWAFKP